MASQVELTPCGAMFDIFKRAAHLSHIELCGLVLAPSARRRPQPAEPSRRSLLGFRFIVRAPVGTPAALLCRIRYLGLRVLCRNWPAPANPMDSGCDQYGVRFCR